MLTQRHFFHQPFGTEFPLNFPEAVFFVSIALIATLTRRNLGIRNEGVLGHGIFEFISKNFLCLRKSSWTEVKSAATLSYILLKHLSLHTWRLEFPESHLRDPRETKRPMGMRIPGSLIMVCRAGLQCSLQFTRNTVCRILVFSFRDNKMSAR